jgi:uncharacterized protein (DUF952 family)
VDNKVGTILHICPHAEWLAALASGVYRAPSLETEGFVHCSRPEQVLPVANRFYQETPDLVLLWIEVELLQSEVRWEAAEGGELFPHVYGPVELDAVSAVTQLIPDPDGSYSKM